MPVYVVFIIFKYCLYIIKWFSTYSYFLWLCTLLCVPLNLHFSPVSSDTPLWSSSLKSIPKYFFSYIHKNVWGPPCCPSPLCPRMSRWREPRWQDTSRQEHPQGFTDFTLTTLSHMATVSLNHTYHWRYIVRRVNCRVIFRYCSLFFGLWWIQYLCVDCDK